HRVRHALSPPPGEVGRDLVGPPAEVQLGLVEDHPAARSALAEIEEPAQLHPEASRAPRVRARRPREGEQLAVEDLAHHLGWHRFERRLHLGGVALDIELARDSGAHPGKIARTSPPPNTAT